MNQQSEWHQKCFYRVGVYGLIKNKKGEILLVNEHGKFSLPGGGWDYGETMKEALRRELFEEISLTSIFDEKIIATVPLYNEPKQAWQLCIVCEILYDELNFGVGEHATEVRWVTMEEILRDPHAGKLVAEFVKLERVK